jgi:predicted neutral ceramidase superfamily lipid hydrolase
MTNIYAPPGSPIIAPEVQSEFKKPKAVLLMQLVGFPLLAFFCYGLVNNAIAFAHGNTWVVAGMSPAVRLVLIAFLTAYTAATLLAIHSRAKISLILGPLLLALLCLPILVVTLLDTGKDERDTAYMFGHYVGMILISAPFVSWGYALAFTERARGYFGSPKKPKAWSL